MMSTCVACAARANPYTPTTNAAARIPEPPLEDDVQIRTSDSSLVIGRLLESNASGVRVAVGDAEREIAWDDVRAMARRLPTTNRWAFTMVWAGFGGFLLGSCGFVFDALNTIGQPYNARISGVLTLLGILIGAVVLAPIGWIIDRLRPKTRWARVPKPGEESEAMPHQPNDY
jgi:hypothetical protein